MTELDNSQLAGVETAEKTSKPITIKDKVLSVKRHWYSAKGNLVAFCIFKFDNQDIEMNVIFTEKSKNKEKFERYLDTYALGKSFNIRGDFYTYGESSDYINPNGEARKVYRYIVRGFSVLDISGNKLGVEMMSESKTDLKIYDDFETALAGGKL